MAQRGDELNTRLTATDDASTVVDRVAGKMGDLEDRPHEIDVDADTSAAERAASQLDRRLEGLTAEQRRVVLEIAARDAQRDLDRINRDLARAQKYDDTEIAIRVNARGDAERKLDAIQAELRDLDGEPVTIRPQVDRSEIDSFLGELPGIGAAARGLAGPGGAVAGIALGLGAAAQEAAGLAREVNQVSNLTGDSLDNASRLVGVWKQNKLDVNDLQDVLLQMSGALNDAPELADRLGINLADGRTTGERFVQVVELLNTRISDAGERGRIASQLFGEEGVRQVNAVTTQVGNLRTAMNNIADTQIISEEDVERQQRFNDKVIQLEGYWRNVKLAAGEATIGPVLDFLTFENADPIALGRNIGRNLGIGIADGLFGGGDDTPSWFDGIREDLQRQLDPTFLDQIGADLRDRIHLAASDEELTSWRLVEESIDRAAVRVNRFGADGVEQMNEVGEAAEDTADKVDGITTALDQVLGRLSEENAVNNLADQWDRVIEAQTRYLTAEKNGTPEATKAQREYRDELFRLAADVGRFAEQVGDIPEQRLTRLALALETGSLTEIERSLDEIFADRMIRLDVNTADPTRFRRTDDGRWERVAGGSTSTVELQPPAPQVNHNTYWTIAPSPAATDEALRDFQFANGGNRAR